MTGRQAAIVFLLRTSQSQDDGRDNLYFARHGFVLLSAGLLRASDDAYRRHCDCEELRGTKQSRKQSGETDGNMHKTIPRVV
jgi:hypothetical protein